MKKAYFIITSFLFLGVFTSKATSLIVSGSVSGQWNVDTVFVEGNLLIPQNESLTIEPGTLIQFQSYFHFDVQGSLLASGALGDTIIFTIKDTSNFYFENQGRGGWSGIRFRQLPGTTDSSIFSFCRFEFGKATEDSLNSYGGAIFVHDFNKIRISNCMFYNNYSFHKGGAIYLQASNAKIYNCTFQNGYSGNKTIGYGYGGGICSMDSSPDIQFNSFFNNKSTGVGGAASFDNSDPVFNNNIMEYNFSGLGGALGILRSAPTSTLSNNIIANNEALFFGGGMCCIRSFPVLSNFTISDNSSAYGGGFYCNDSASPSMYNSIIWNNEAFGVSVYIWDVYSAPSFYYCNIMGDTAGFEGSGSHLGYKGEYLNNINSDPLFQFQTIQKYYPLPESPCIDAGTPNATFLNLPEIDIAGFMRIYNNQIDMGAYEYKGFLNFRTNAKSLLQVNVFPNPFFEKCTLKLTDGNTSNGKIEIYTINGKKIRQLTFQDNQVEWDGNNEEGNTIEKGVYIAQINMNGIKQHVKLLKF